MATTTVQLLCAEMGRVRELDIRPSGPHDRSAQWSLDFLWRVAASAIARAGRGGQVRPDLCAAVAGGAFGVARQGGLDLVAVYAVGAKTCVRIDPGAGIHVAGVRELGEKLSFVAG